MGLWCLWARNTFQGFLDIDKHIKIQNINIYIDIQNKIKGKSEDSLQKNYSREYLHVYTPRHYLKEITCLTFRYFR